MIINGEPEMIGGEMHRVPDFWTFVKLSLNSVLGNGSARRKDIVRSMVSPECRVGTIRGYSVNTFNSYLNYLTKAGYLNRPRRGVYSLARGQIPSDLSVEQVKSEAYGIIDTDGNRRVVWPHDDDTEFIGVVPAVPGGVTPGRTAERQPRTTIRLDPPKKSIIPEKKPVLPDWRV